MYFELRILTENDKNIIEHFFEEASDYAIIESGESNPQLECESLLNDLPPEKTKSDKFVYGIFNDKSILIGLVDLLKDFPTKGEFMLGLLEFVPEVRHQGLGKAVHEILVEKVRHLGANSLRIGVLEVNIAALKFWKSLGYIKFKETELEFGSKRQKIDVMRLNLKD